MKLSIRTDGDASELASLQVNLAQHDEIATAFFASGSCQRVAGSWELSFPLEASEHRRLVQLVKVTDAEGHGIDIPHLQLFFEPSGEGEWEAGDKANAELKRVEMERERRFSVTLRAEGAGAGNSIFSTVMLVDNLLLRVVRRVPGVVIIPLTDSTLGSDTSQVLNSVLQQLGYEQLIDPERWLEQMRHRRPAAIFHVPRVEAEGADAAYKYCRQRVHELLDLLALKRGDAPRLIGGVIASVDEEGRSHFQGASIEGSGYAGNILSGFGSGDDAHSLLAQWESLRGDARLRLWLSLYADAIGDERWDYRLFRCFNLLEGIASEKVERKGVVDSEGNAILKPYGKPYTTKETRGKVYELIRVVAKATDQAESNFTSTPDLGGASALWDEVGIWASVRNAVAHLGGWDVIPKEQTLRERREEQEQQILRRSHDGTLDAGAWAAVRTIRSAAESTLFAALQQRI
ncbi:MucBP domain-containing protein [Streptomyces flavidovirens]|uniref:MucBP domain-containing protein n=1 Tax=Streptomyces flavidovirens TaxID=67298 RepID=UPI0033B50AD1